eukprot:12911333-Prorocentrum_lima.AAC.1
MDTPLPTAATAAAATAPSEDASASPVAVAALMMLLVPSGGWRIQFHHAIITQEFWGGSPLS